MKIKVLSRLRNRLREAKSFKNPYVRNVLSALAVPIFGYILLNLTFLFYALIINSVLWFLPTDFARTSQWFMPFMLIIVGLIIVLISWFVFKTKLGIVYKAIYSTAPLAVTFVTIGILLYILHPSPALAYSINTLVFGAILFYLYRTKQPWLYYYTVILVALSLLVFTLLGGEI